MHIRKPFHEVTGILSGNFRAYPGGPAEGDVADDGPLEFPG